MQIIKKKISIIHPYLESRRSHIETGHYPKHHLWGIDEIESSSEFNSRFISTQNYKIHNFLEKILNKTIFKGTVGVRIELSALKASRTSDFIYSVCGPLAVSKFAPKKFKNSENVADKGYGH